MSGNILTAGGARGASGGHARPRGRGRSGWRRADAPVAPGDGRSIRQVRGFLHPGPDTVRGWAAGRAGSAGPAWPRWIRRRIRSVRAS